MNLPRKFTFSLGNVLLAMVPLAGICAVVGSYSPWGEGPVDWSSLGSASYLLGSMAIGALCNGLKGMAFGVGIGLLLASHVSFFVMAFFFSSRGPVLPVFLAGYCLIVAGVWIGSAYFNPQRVRTMGMRGAMTVYVLTAFGFSARWD